jgi:hypothetical protein
MKSLKKIKKILHRSVPLWLVLVLMIQIGLASGLLEAYVAKQKMQQLVISLSKTTKNPDQLAQILKQEVLPQAGFSLAVQWKDIGQELLKTGAIDKTKYDQLFVNEPKSKEQMKYLSGYSSDHMAINENNSHFMVNTLWAIGLVNKIDVLDNGPMKTVGNGDPMGYASTGGWSLGAKDTSQIYSSVDILKLTPQQQELVKKIADNIYRPCCGNPTSFPDCNHGMAALGYVEMAVKQGVSENRIYKDVAALNSFWFPQQYVSIAAYFNKNGTDWKKVDPKTLLSQQYSSAQGAQQIQQEVQSVPGLNVQSGGCGA